MITHPIGVGGREIGYLFGQYKRLTNRYESGVLAGKSPHWRGALVRREATGYGVVRYRAVGGQATQGSGASPQQNASRDAWTFSYTEQRLHEIMCRIHRDCYETAETFGRAGNDVIGSNIAGFRRVAEAMLAVGVV